MKKTAEEIIFTNEMESFIKKGIPLKEDEIENLTELYCDYLKSYGEYHRVLTAKKDFKLGLIFGTKIHLK